MIIILLDSIKEFVTYKLALLMRGDFSDIAAIQRYKHYLESTIFSILNSRKIFPEENLNTPEMILQRLVEWRLLSSKVYNFYLEHEDFIAADLLGLITECPDDIAGLYEALLQSDFSINSKSAFYEDGKVTRDAMGLYYTPPDFALQIVRNAWKAYGKHSNTQRFADDLQYADFSCGCGEFFQALLQFLPEAVGCDPSVLCLRFWGSDIDPIALQVTICQLLPFAEIDSWSDLISHFFLGNPLISATAETSYDKKVDLFANGRYYSELMGFSPSSPIFSTKFDIVLGNPPWEKIRFEERKFFKHFRPDISAISQKEKRTEQIQHLKCEQAALWKYYQDILDDYKEYSRIAKKHPLLQNSLHGELNTYALFTELAFRLLKSDGVFSLIVKSSLVTMPTHSDLFRMMASQLHLISIFLFDNTERMFSIDSREKFCVMTAGRGQYPTLSVAAGLVASKQMQTTPPVKLSYDALQRVNPLTSMLPNVSSTNAIDLLARIHSFLPVFGHIYPNCHFGRIVHLTMHASHIETSPTPETIPIYEGKFIHQYDARYSTFAGITEKDKYSPKASASIQSCNGNIKPTPVSRYFINARFWESLRKNYPESYSLCWRSLTSTTNSRTMVAMILPTMPTCQSIQLLQNPDSEELLYILGLFNSKCFDALVRLKMPGIDLTQSVIKQIPVPPPSVLNGTITFYGETASIKAHILYRVAALLYLEPLTKPLASHYMKCGTAFFADAQQELDELFLLAYNFSAEERQLLFDYTHI